MNWVNGMLRVWFALSFIWICAFCVASAYVWNVDAPARAAAAEWTRLVTECGTPQAPKTGPWCDLIPSAETRLSHPIDGLSRCRTWSPDPAFHCWLAGPVGYTRVSPATQHESGPALSRPAANNKIDQWPRALFLWIRDCLIQ